MTETTLNAGRTPLPDEEAGPHWLRRAALVVFSVALLATIGVAFTRTIAARVPQQRATLEKLIADRTGLQVRFDNVHFAWNLDGTSAVFTRVELTDPQANRVRVVAPELRVKFDTWDFLRHQQFSFGHVTLASPDIEITADADAEAPAAATSRARRAVDALTTPDPPRDEATLLRHYTAWMEVMPTGRIEVEGARVHLKRRGDPRPHHTFTLSQAVVSRGARNFNAWGTLLLAQDVGQSLFVSAKVEGLAAGSTPSMDLRLIARRIFLDKLSASRVDGRGTLDAKVHVSDGRVESATWQASARDLVFEDGARFDHLVFDGRLSRDAADIVLALDDLRLTRGARLERVPSLAARIELEPGAPRVARTSVRAGHVPFMAGELLAALAPSRLAPATGLAGGWSVVAGALEEVVVDSGTPRSTGGWTLSARIVGAELARADHARIAQLTGLARADAQAVAFTFDSAYPVAVQLAGMAEPRLVNIGGTLAVSTQIPRRVTLTDLAAQSGASRVAAAGEWHASAPALDVRITNIDRVLAGDLWRLFAGDAAGESAQPELLAQIVAGSVSGGLQLMPARDSRDFAAVDWPRSRGQLDVEALALRGDPQLAAARGALEFARGAAQLRLSSGRVDDVTLTSARVDWPRTGAPRLHATLEGGFDSKLLRRALAGQGLDRLHGAVVLEADARGEQELRTPASWRVTARVADASLALAAGVPPIDRISGTVRYAEGTVRTLNLAGQWLGGAVSLDGRRANARAPLVVALSGVTDAQPLLRALEQPEAASRVSGQLAWNGGAQRFTGAQGADDAWRVTLASNLVGVESRLGEPLAKTRARAWPLEAELRVDAGGVREFSVEGRDVALRGEVRDAAVTAQFSVQGVTGDARVAADPGVATQVRVDRIDLKRAPALFAATQVLLASGGTARITIDDLRSADRDLGAMRAALARAPDGVRFDLASADTAAHRIAAQGLCDDGRCRATFSLDTQRLAELVRGMRLPPEWPTRALHARGELSWPDSGTDLTRALAGTVEIDARGADEGHEMFASATVAEGNVSISSLQGAGPDPTQVFRGSGRLGLLARDYDFALEYEQVSTLAANTVPTSARARLARALNALRGSAARSGWAEAPRTRHVQWQGAWDDAQFNGDIPDLLGKGDAPPAR